MCNGYRADEEKKYRERWEVARWEVFYLLNIQIKETKRFKRLTDLIRFPWDERPNITLATAEDFRELCEKWGGTLA